VKYLLRLGSDLTLKSDKIRRRFVSRLLQNLRSAFAFHGIEYTLERQWSRIFVDAEDPRALEVLSRIHGIHSFSPIDVVCEASLPVILERGVEAFKELVAGKKFVVRARRIGTHDYTSMDLMQRLGAALVPFARGVDLHRPEVEVSVEVREAVAYLYSRHVRGPAGLPLGVSGKVLCLISGGFDSAVAAWMLQKRGVEMDYLFCNLAGAAYERSVLTVTKFLASEWGHGTRPKLHILDFQPLADHLRERVRPSHAQVLLKRMFYRAGEHVARHVGASALLTGECIGQVSSQTLPNLCTIEAVLGMPVIRPLIGFEKEEITQLARRIGTFDLSAAVQEYCQLVPDRPATACSRQRAEEEEAKLDPAVLAAAIASRRTLVLHELKAVDLVTPYIYVDKIPEDAVVIDCRPQEFYDAWHYPGALNLELHDVLTQLRSFDRERTYVLYCPIGLQSAVAAERMQKAGFTAYSVKGGLKALHPSM
jgi:thiamine biosynthesis protein ThiI